jgi:hypothetical protein
VKQRLRELVGQLPNLQCRYEYDEPAGLHLVEVLPLAAYKLDERYLALEEVITFEFIEAFPFENIAIVSEDSLVGVSNPIFEVGGTQHDMFNRIEEQVMLAMPNWEVRQAAKQAIWPNYVNETVEPSVGEVVIVGAYSFAMAA